VTVFRAPDHRYLVPFDGSFHIDRAPTAPPKGAPDRDELERDLARSVDRLGRLQGRLYRTDRAAVLVIFQAMDAAGKDGTIAAVLTGVNPAGCQVFSFKVPNDEERDHDFLWRHARCLPERGRIGIFNRSWYEEVLAVRVHPEFLDAQRLPWRPSKNGDLWDERLESIADFEKHLARNGTAVVKFFLHVSKDEQRERLEARIADPEKNWKVQPNDVYERQRWDDYQKAYQSALRATSASWAPWYAIPADDKRYLRATVASILADALESLPLEASRDPELDRRLAEARDALRKE
jgi:PPK2 family polyphosphate:nucleotide phosphotransferase